jgi:hypothetical protein
VVVSSARDLRPALSKISRIRTLSKIRGVGDDLYDLEGGLPWACMKSIWELECKYIPKPRFLLTSFTGLGNVMTLVFLPTFLSESLGPIDSAGRYKAFIFESKQTWMRWRLYDDVGSHID